MHPFYSRLSYSFGNEDWLTEHQALQLQADSHVLCITASGDRPLNLLVADCAKIQAIDANPVQNALLDLKKSALTHLSYDEYIAFLGLSPMEDRLKYYHKLRQNLSHPSQLVWRRHHHKIRKGILFQGSVEKLAVAASRTIRLFRRAKIERLFSFNNLSEQALFIDKEFNTPLWKKLFKMALHPKLVCTFLKDPGLSDYVDQRIHVGEHLHAKVHNSLKRFLAKESILISLIFNGKVDLDHLPPYLSKQSVATIRNRLDRLHFETKDLISYLKEVPEGSFDRFSFSDVASYMPYETFKQVLQLMIRAAKPNSRFCIRQFLSNYPIPPELQKHIKRDVHLEQELESKDRCCVYRFLVGHVIK